MHADFYPRRKPNLSTSKEVLAPEDMLEKKSTVCLIQTTVKIQAPISLKLAGKLIDPTRYSKLSTLLKTTAYINRYISNIRSKEEDRKYGPRCQPLDSEDIIKRCNFRYKEV